MDKPEKTTLEQMKYALEAALVYILTDGVTRSREWMLKTLAKALGMGDVNVDAADKLAGEYLKKFPLPHTIIEDDGRLWIVASNGNVARTNITISKSNAIPRSDS